MAKQISKTLLQIILLELQILKIRFQISVLKKKLTIPNLKEWKILILHHGGGPLGFYQVNAHHTNKWGFISSLGFGLGYQKWVAYTGKLFIARRDNEEGAHTKGHNKGTVGLCFRGNMEEEDLTGGQKKTGKEQIDYYKAKGYIVRLHKDYSATLCPGKYLIKWLAENRYI